MPPALAARSAADAVPDAEPDGYAMTVGSLGVVVQPRVRSTRTCRSMRGKLGPVGLIAGTPGYLVVRKEFPAKTYAEFQDYVKANPGKVTSGHAGVGSPPHLQCLLLSSLTGLKLSEVPYKGVCSGDERSCCRSDRYGVRSCFDGGTAGAGRQYTRAAGLAAAPRGALTVVHYRPRAKRNQPICSLAGMRSSRRKAPPLVVDPLSAALLAALADAGVQKAYRRCRRHPRNCRRCNA